jgi:hypothetical protein
LAADFQSCFSKTMPDMNKRFAVMCVFFVFDQFAGKWCSKPEFHKWNLSQLIFFVYFYENVCNLDNNRLICDNWFPINVQRTLFQIYLFIEFVLKILLICFRKTGDSTANYRPTCRGIKKQKSLVWLLEEKVFREIKTTFGNRNPQWPVPNYTVRKFQFISLFCAK